jgi:hypothetical protein
MLIRPWLSWFQATVSLPDSILFKIKWLTYIRAVCEDLNVSHLFFLTNTFLPFILAYIVQPHLKLMLSLWRSKSKTFHSPRHMGLLQKNKRCTWKMNSHSKMTTLPLSHIPSPQISQIFFFSDWSPTPGSSDVPVSTSQIAGTIGVHHYIQQKVFYYLII